MSDLLHETDLKRGTAKEPPKQWRNWFRALVDYEAAIKLRNIHTGERVSRKTGEVFHGRIVWPSKDAAETFVLHDMGPNDAFRKGEREWLGAFPEGETP